MKNIRIFYMKIFPFLVVKFSIYLNRHVFVMTYDKNLPGAISLLNSLNYNTVLFPFSISISSVYLDQATGPGLRFWSTMFANIRRTHG